MEENITTIPNNTEPSSFKLISSLGIAGFISGLVLVSIYLFTKPIIEENKTLALQSAIFKVLPGTDSFETLVYYEGKLSNSEDKNQQGDNIYLGLNKDGDIVGFAIPGSEPGFQDIIGVIYGYSAIENTIIGFEVLESKETPGLGDKIFKDADFQSNFTSLVVDPEIKAVKKGEKNNNNEVEAITGATISSKAIVRLLNKSVQKWKLPMEEYLSSNNLKFAKYE